MCPARFHTPSESQQTRGAQQVTEGNHIQLLDPMQLRHNLTGPKRLLHQSKHTPDQSQALSECHKRSIGLGPLHNPASKCTAIRKEAAASTYQLVLPLQATSLQQTVRSFVCFVFCFFCCFFFFLRFFAAKLDAIARPR